MTKVSLRDAFLKPVPRRMVKVTVPADYPNPELAGKSFTLRAMSAYERTIYERAFAAVGNGANAEQVQNESRARLLVATVIDPSTGSLLFTSEDIPALMQVDAGLVDLLVTEALKLVNLVQDQKTISGN